MTKKYNQVSHKEFLEFMDETKLPFSKVASRFYPYNTECFTSIPSWHMFFDPKKENGKRTTSFFGVEIIDGNVDSALQEFNKILKSELSRYSYIIYGKKTLQIPNSNCLIIEAFNYTLSHAPTRRASLPIPCVKFITSDSRVFIATIASLILYEYPTKRQLENKLRTLNYNKQLEEEKARKKEASKLKRKQTWEAKRKTLESSPSK